MNFNKILLYTIYVLLIVIPIALILAITYYLGWKNTLLVIAGYVIKSIVIFFGKIGSKKA